MHDDHALDAVPIGPDGLTLAGATSVRLRPGAASGPGVPPRALTLDPERCRRNIDQTDFAIGHGLHDSPLFDMPSLERLIEATSKHRPQDLYFDVGPIEPGQRWNDMPAHKLTVFDALERIETADAWIILRRAHLIAEYAEVLNGCMADLLRVCDSDFVRLMREREALVIITSPRRVTAFHMDRECGFLLQMRGSKEISLYNRNDRDVLPEDEIERFWTKDNNAPTYRPHLQSRATVYRLEPGCGVHIPVNAPHWLKNDNNVSVSVNINFVHSENARGNIYRANYHLRKMGFNPTPPFRSPLLDRVKAPIGALTAATREAVRRSRSLLGGRS